MIAREEAYNNIDNSGKIWNALNDETIQMVYGILGKATGHALQKDYENV